MKFPVYVEVVCGRCSKAGPGCYSYSGIPRRDLRAEARNHGWCLIRDADGYPDWNCPDCTKGIIH